MRAGNDALTRRPDKALPIDGRRLRIRARCRQGNYAKIRSWVSLGTVSESSRSTRRAMRVMTDAFQRNTFRRCVSSQKPKMPMGGRCIAKI